MFASEVRQHARNGDNPFSIAFALAPCFRSFLTSWTDASGLLHAERSLRFSSVLPAAVLENELDGAVSFSESAPLAFEMRDLRKEKKASTGFGRLLSLGGGS